MYYCNVGECDCRYGNSSYLCFNKLNSVNVFTCIFWAYITCLLTKKCSCILRCMVLMTNKIGKHKSLLSIESLDLEFFNEPVAHGGITPTLIFNMCRTDSDAILSRISLLMHLWK